LVHSKAKGKTLSLKVRGDPSAL